MGINKLKNAELSDVETTKGGAYITISINDRIKVTNIDG